MSIANFRISVADGKDILEHFEALEDMAGRLYASAHRSPGAARAFNDTFALVCAIRQVIYAIDTNKMLKDVWYVAERFSTSDGSFEDVLKVFDEYDKAAK